MLHQTGANLDAKTQGQRLQWVTSVACLLLHLHLKTALFLRAISSTRDKQRDIPMTALSLVSGRFTP